VGRRQQAASLWVFRRLTALVKYSDQLGRSEACPARSQTSNVKFPRLTISTFEPIVGWVETVSPRWRR
jgi:hypothetical protein